MPDYIKREEAKNAIHAVQSYRESLMFSALDLDADGVIQKSLLKLDVIPAANVAEIVRCKYCEYSHWEDESDTSSAFKCSNPNGLFEEVDFNDFCSYAKRKEGENG